MLSTLQPARVNDPHAAYQASDAVIAAMVAGAVEGLSETEAQSLIQFATLDSAGIRRLLGKSSDEGDVPVWEHTKRGSRYTIQPLIRVADGTLGWGAAAADRALSIWTGSVANGYLPADFNWPRIKAVVRTVKAGLEEALEVQAFNVCSRATPFLLRGIDLKYKFPMELFDAVGDYDVLAYWPDANRMAEY